MRKATGLFVLFAAFALALAVVPVWAQTDATTAATPAATMAAPAAPMITVGGLVDGYYTYNFTNSSKGMNGHGNYGYNYGGVDLNSMDDTFSLSVAEMVVQMKQGDVSGVVALWMQGQSGLSGMNLLVANATYNAGQFSFMGGRFGDWMGNEAFDTNANWNYSHSLLYNFTLPLWLQGVNVTYTPSDSIMVKAYATEGWVADPGNFVDYGKTYGLQIGLKPDSNWGVKLNGILGPNGGWFSDLEPGDSLYVGEAIISYKASDDFSLALDGEYGGIDPVNGEVAPSANPLLIPPIPLKTESFWGAALYGKYQIATDWNVALRLEELESNDNWLYKGGIPTVGGSPYVEIREATLTLSDQVTKNLLFRVEGRYDMGYTGGTMDDPSGTPAMGPYAGGSGGQLTGTGSAVFSF